MALDSIVFVDDNPAECALVRQFLPEVDTLCIGDNPAEFVPLFEGRHWFDAQAITAEDTERTMAYVSRRLAVESRGVGDLDEYLAGLEMIGHFGAAVDSDLARLAQLELKTNQFNTTGKRYSADAISEFMRRMMR